MMMFLALLLALLIVVFLFFIFIKMRFRRVDAHFVTFADAKYAATLRRIERQAEGLFAHVHARGDLGPDFWNAHSSFVRDNPRGYGYWIWKPYVVRRALAGMREGEVLVYADAGCTLNANNPARLKNLVAMTAARDDGITAFLVPMRYDPREGRWTKREVLRAFGADDDATRQSRQIMATAFLIKNTARNRSFVDEWYHRCSRYAFVDDTLTEDQHPEFSEHRHDQSLFSMLIKTTRRDAIILEDEIETHRGCDAIWATRKKY